MAIRMHAPIATVVISTTLAIGELGMNPQYTVEVSHTVDDTQAIGQCPFMMENHTERRMNCAEAPKLQLQCGM